MKTAILALSALCAAGCMPLTPIRTCEHGAASYRDSYKWFSPTYGQIEIEVWMQCGIVVQARPAP
jgi:hypothetical protein